MAPPSTPRADVRTPGHPADPGPGGGARAPRGTRVRRRRWALLAAALVALVAIPTWSVAGALAAPGTDTTAARLAEWARGHGLGPVVTALEQLQYDLDPPAVGGRLAGGIPTAPADSATTTAAPGPGASRTNDYDVAPAAIPSQARPALPGEGVWRTLLSVSGHPAARVAFLRPDSRHTSYAAGVVWMDPHLLTFRLHPGYTVPGAVPHVADSLTGSEQATVLATFNSGFKMVDARGGYWQSGHTVVRLRTGAASMVFTTSGGLDVRAWPGGSPGPGVLAVRQNLDLLVDNGKVTHEVSDRSSAVWGRTVGNAAYVWRSALGVRADGSLVFVVGPALSVHTLADLIHAAGAVRAMELDINKDWTNFLLYHHGSGGSVTPDKLTPDEVPNSYRYLQPSSRDFVAVLPR